MIDGTIPTPLPRLRLGLLLWAAGTLGAVAVAVGVLPQVSATMPLPAPMWLVMLASIAQSALLVALAVWSGVALGSRVGLRAPAFEAAAARRPLGPPIKPQILPGLLAGLLGGPLLFVSLRLSPAGIAALHGRFTPPLTARILYGGITEEVLLRWGLMTAFAWLAWRFIQRTPGPVRPGTMWLAIFVSALLFGAGHLPVAFYVLGSLTAPTVMFVVGLNAIFGLIFGWLYWRRGLEAAMIGHAFTHLISWAVTQMSGSIGSA